MSSYRVSVDGMTVRVKNFRDARTVVANAVTTLLAQDPEAVAREAMVVNEAFESGAAEHSLTAHRSWRTTLTVNGEPVPITVEKRWW